MDPGKINDTHFSAKYLYHWAQLSVLLERRKTETKQMQKSYLHSSWKKRTNLGISSKHLEPTGEIMRTQNEPQENQKSMELDLKKIGLFPLSTHSSIDFFSYFLTCLFSCCNIYWSSTLCQAQSGYHSEQNKACALMEPLPQRQGMWELGELVHTKYMERPDIY